MSSSSGAIFRHGLELRDGVVTNVRLPLALISGSPDFDGIAERDCLRGDLIVRGGNVAGMARSGSPGADLDLEGRIVTPPLVEAHCHLDKAFTASRLGFAGGSLREAIDAQERDIANWTADDLRSRATRALDELTDAGCGLVRTHVNWTANQSDPQRPPLAWEVLGDLADEWRDTVTLQRAALLSPEDLTDEAKVNAVASRIARDGGVLGAFVFDHLDRAGPITRLVEAADRFGLALDFHVDEGLAPELDGIEIIADTVIAARYDGPVLCGHVCNLAALEGDALARRIERIVQAGLAVVALPTTNLYLQDRGPGTPRQRGITRIRELVEAGVTVAVGTDNVQDAFCPIGRHDPLRSLGMAILAAHLDPPLSRWLPLVSGKAERALGMEPTGIARMAADRLIVWNAGSVENLFSR